MVNQTNKTDITTEDDQMPTSTESARTDAEADNAVESFTAAQVNDTVAAAVFLFVVGNKDLLGILQGSFVFI